MVLVPLGWMLIGAMLFMVVHHNWPTSERLELSDGLPERGVPLKIESIVPNLGTLALIPGNTNELRITSTKILVSWQVGATKNLCTIPSEAWPELGPARVGTTFVLAPPAPGTKKALAVIQ